MSDFSKLKEFGINPEDIHNYDILCLPERFDSELDTFELRDTTDSIKLFKLLKKENINCANSYALGLDVKVYERRGIDLWLGTIYILKVSSIPLLMGIIGRLIGAKIEEIFLRKQEKIVDKIHADINIEDGEINASISFQGDSETFLKVLNSISKKNNNVNDQ